MQRIAIIGNAGGGKSVLARQLGDRLNIPIHQIDELQWQPGWIPTPEAEVAEGHVGWLLTPEWIIDGWGNWDILEQRFKAADTIILVDFPILVHYWWAAKRQLKAMFTLNRDWPPQGCHALPVTGRLFKLMWKIHRERLPQLVELIYQYQADTEIMHLKSPREMRRFIIRYS
jgi:hypothetical protein